MRKSQETVFKTLRTRGKDNRSKNRSIKMYRNTIRVNLNTELVYWTSLYKQKSFPKKTDVLDLAFSLPILLYCHMKKSHPFQYARNHFKGIYYHTSKRYIFIVGWGLKWASEQHCPPPWLDAIYEVAVKPKEYKEQGISIRLLEIRNQVYPFFSLWRS